VLNACQWLDLLAKSINGRSKPGEYFSKILNYSGSNISTNRYKCKQTEPMTRILRNTSRARVPTEVHAIIEYGKQVNK